MRSLLDYFNPDQGSFRDIASNYFSGRKKSQKSGNKYLLGALLLGLGDIRAQKKAQTKYDEFQRLDTVNRAKAKKEFEDYTNFFATHKTYTKDGQQSWEEGLRRDIVAKNGTLREDKILDIYNTEANLYEKKLNKFSKGKFEEGLKQEKTYEELLAPYEKISANVKRKLNPDNAKFLKNVFGDAFGIKEDADNILDTFKTESNNYINSFNTAVSNVQKTYGFQMDEYLSDAQQLLNKKNEVQNEISKINSRNEVIPTDLILQAHAVGINPSGYKHLDNLSKENTTKFVEAIEAKRALNKYGIENSEIYLTPSQQEIISVVMPSTREEINTREQIEDENNRARVTVSIKNNISRLEGSQNPDDKQRAAFLQRLSGDFIINNKNQDASTEGSALFVDNVIKGAVELQRINPAEYTDDFDKALKDSFQLQELGVTSKKQGRTRFGGNLASTEYVNPKVLNMPIVPETANMFARNLNDYGYLQREIEDDTGKNGMKIDENNKSLEGKTLTFSGTDRNNTPFQVNLVLEKVKDKNDNDILNWVVIN